jgi:beta-galactosidase GanA
MSIWCTTTGFPVDTRGVGQEILSAFSESVLDADSCAFAALMRRLREIDGKQNTVIMVQVENEIGMLPCARDMSETANQLYAGPVPDELLSYLGTHSETLVEKLRSQWETAGRRMAGTWEEVFGPGDATEEIFMAWHYAVFTGRLAAAGKTEYPLPMYVNAALNRRPGRIHHHGIRHPYHLRTRRAGLADCRVRCH